MSQNSSRRMAWVLLAILAGAAMVSAGPGALVPHQAPALGDQRVLGSSTEGASGLPGAGLPPLGDAAAGEEAGGALGSAAGAAPSTGSGLPQKPTGVPVVESAEKPELRGSVSGRLAASVGNPYDALLLSTGSASSLAMAYSPRMGPATGLAPDAAPDSAVGIQAAAADLVSGKYNLQGDAQRALLEAARMAGLPAVRADFQRPLGPDALERATAELFEAINVQMSAEERVRIAEGAARLDPRVRDGTALIMFAVAEAQRAMAKTVGGLTFAERQLLASCVLGSGAGSCLDPGAAATLAANKLDRLAMVQATLNILSAVDTATPWLMQAKAEGLQPSSGHPVDVWGDGLLYDPQISSGPQGTTAFAESLFRDPWSFVQVGGTGSDLYLGNTFGSMVDSKTQILTIDLDGMDAYFSRAGGTYPWIDIDSSMLFDSLTDDLFGPYVSVTIDLGGDDYYENFGRAQGSGSMGIGVLVELGGNDIYRSGASEAQGAANTGIGLLIDATGNDIYSSPVASQGYGTDGGIGLLVDLFGNDQYTGDSFMQGVGEYLGAGLLIDYTGNDLYSAVAASGSPTVSQGSADRTGLGVLADGDGADRYIINVGGRGFIMPRSLTSSNGVAVFFDGRGIDSYEPSSVVNGGNNRNWRQGNVGLGFDGQ